MSLDQKLWCDVYAAAVRVGRYFPMYDADEAVSEYRKRFCTLPEQPLTEREQKIVNDAVTALAAEKLQEVER